MQLDAVEQCLHYCSHTHASRRHVPKRLFERLRVLLGDAGLGVGGPAFRGARDKTPPNVLVKPMSRTSLLFATAYAEFLRPLFDRWAADEVRALYERATSLMWDVDSASASSSTRSLIPSQIKQLPESECDDSNTRDFHVMLGLGVLYFASKIALKMPSTPEEDARELDAIGDHLANVFDVPSTIEELRASATRLSSSDSADAKREMRNLAIRAAAALDAALDATADERGWPHDRIRVR